MSEPMLESKNTQFTLSAKGEILWQEKLNNPLPGEAVAVLEKGKQSLKPVITLLDNDLTAVYKGDAEKQQALLNQLNVWFQWYVGETLGALVALEIPQGVEPKTDAVSKIAAEVYEGMGIIPRAQIEGLISQLTPECRAALRSKKIRLGPVLVFIPELNKPAAVRLRALLWSLHNGRDLPAQVPADGIVSVSLEDETADPLYYRSIGYPLYGGRAVRIDMLDRVISCVYDHAEGGKFQARHEMAEWLGCSIEGLYKVLEAMGHVKIHDPADDVSSGDDAPYEGDVSGESQPGQGAAVKEDCDVDSSSADGDESGDSAKDSQAGSAKVTDKKPELATFRLKKGKAFQTGAAGGKKGAEKKKGQFKGGKKQGRANVKKGKAEGRRKDYGPRVITAEAQVSEADNPFAVLQQLKK